LPCLKKRLGKLDKTLFQILESIFRGGRISEEAHFLYPACGKVKIDNDLLIRR
jgi:hypothetical protein